jgi:Domain of unknown function (DUF4136)
VRRACLLALLLLAACTPKVHVDYDTTADFRALRYYAWLPAPPPPADAPVYADRTLMERRVRASADAVLQARDYQPARAEPDFQLNAFFVLTPGYYDPEEVVTLVFDVVDPRRNVLLWRGSRETGLHRSDDPADRDACIDTAVKAILDTFPPPQ